MRTNTLIAVLAVLSSAPFLAAPAFAADDMAAVEPNANSGDGQGVPILSGGVGDDEMNYIKSVEHQYNLKLMFTETSGVFLSDLPVTISDRQGNTVVNTVTKGPILLVSLPNGSYTVSATDGDMKLNEKIAVSGSGLHTHQFRFQGNDMKSSD